MAGLVSVVVVEDTLLDRLAGRLIHERLGRRLGSPKVEIGDVSVGLLAAGVRVEGLRIGDPDRPSEPAVALQSVGVTWRWADLLGDGPISLGGITARGGRLHFYRREDGTYSFQRPKQTHRQPASRPANPSRRRHPKGRRRRLLCRSIRLRDLAITYHDYKRPLEGPFPPFRLIEFRADDLAVPLTADGPTARFKLRAGIDSDSRAVLHSWGSVRLLGHLPEVAFGVQARRIPLTAVNQLFARKMPFLAQSGWVDFQARADYHNERLHGGRTELWLREIDQVRVNPVYVPEGNGDVAADQLVARLNTGRNWYLPMKFSREVHKLKWRPRWLQLRPIDVSAQTQSPAPR